MPFEEKEMKEFLERFMERVVSDSLVYYLDFLKEKFSEQYSPKDLQQVKEFLENNSKKDSKKFEKNSKNNEKLKNDELNNNFNASISSPRENKISSVFQKMKQSKFVGYLNQNVKKLKSSSEIKFNRLFPFNSLIVLLYNNLVFCKKKLLEYDPQQNYQEQFWKIFNQYKILNKFINSKNFFFYTFFFFFFYTFFFIQDHIFFFIRRELKRIIVPIFLNIPNNADIGDKFKPGFEYLETQINLGKKNFFFLQIFLNSFFFSPANNIHSSTEKDKALETIYSCYTSVIEKILLPQTKKRLTQQQVEALSSNSKKFCEYFKIPTKMSNKITLPLDNIFQIYFFSPDLLYTLLNKKYEERKYKVEDRVILHILEMSSNIK